MPISQKYSSSVFCFQSHVISFGLEKKVLPALFERLFLSVNLFVSDIPFLLAVVSFSVPVSVGLAWREHAIFKI